MTFWRTSNRRRGILLICSEKVHFVRTFTVLKKCEYYLLFPLFSTSANKQFVLIRVRVHTFLFALLRTNGNPSLIYPSSFLSQSVPHIFMPVLVLHTPTAWSHIAGLFWTFVPCCCTRRYFLDKDMIPPPPPSRLILLIIKDNCLFFWVFDSIAFWSTKQGYRAKLLNKYL